MQRHSEADGRRMPSIGARGRSVRVEDLRSFDSRCVFALEDSGVHRLGQAKGEAPITSRSRSCVGCLSLPVMLLVLIEELKVRSGSPMARVPTVSIRRRGTLDQ